MEYKDYYKLLDVDKKASGDEIKRAYRKLALKYHPDRNPGDAKAEEKFKEINEAYQVLSDSTKRARFDQLGASYTQWQQQRGASGGFNWDEWVTSSPGGNVRVEVGNMDDILGGIFSEFYSRVFGGMPDMGTASPGRQPSRRRTRPEKLSYQQDLTISLTEAYQGTTRRINVDGRRLDVKIPPGARTGTKVRVANAVSGSGTGQKGDLYLVIRVADDPRFERKKSDLYTDVSIDLYTAVLGGEVTVQTLSGHVVLTIPAGTQPGQNIRLVGRGMPHLRKPDTHGDLITRIRINIPRNLTSRQKELFEELSNI